MIYDSDRSVVVLQGGALRCESLEGASDYSWARDDTWEWNGVNWGRVGSSAAGDRYNAAMAHDSLLNVTVLFGGDGCSDPDCHVDHHVLRTGTWEYRSGAWTQAPGSTPALRVGHTMAFDSWRNRIVMFGGGGILGDDTDEYTAGVGWTSLLDSGPPPRSFHRMVFDSRRGVMVMYGGLNESTLLSTFDDTWELDVCTRPPEVVVQWVDFAYTVGEELGTFAEPFSTLARGVAAIPAGGMLRIKAGTTSEKQTISKPMTLSAYGGPVTIGQ
jgi:hypothetical protein